jgi:hypothetical protein
MSDKHDDLIVVRDRRRRRFYVADNLIIDHYLPIIGDKGLTLYSLLCRLASDKVEMARPGYGLLCEHTGWSRSTVWAYRRLLELVGLVKVVSGGGRRTNVYYLLDVQPLSEAGISAITDKVQRGFNNGFQRQILERLNGWRSLQSRFHAPERVTVVGQGEFGQGEFSFHGEATQFHHETGPRDEWTTQFHGETGSTRIDQESKNKNQEQAAATRPATPPVAADVASALSEAGILATSHLSIVLGWFGATGEALTVDDVSAWVDYVEATNASRPDRRGHLRSGFIVDQLRRGNAAPQAAQDSMTFAFIN